MLENSSKIYDICKLNKKYEHLFTPLSKEIFLTINCKTKAEFDRTVLRDFLFHSVLSNKKYYKDLINITDHNSIIYDYYTKDFSAILSSTNEKTNELYKKYKFFQKTENRLCNYLIFDPTTNLIINVEKTYTSPQGRNHYQDNKEFYKWDIINCLDDAEEVLKQRNTAKYQRSQMNNSIRYDVMRRDGFKCVLCGATQKDGITLHVDHIKPVSKGGKTEMSNLRTLCNRCNSGKGAKYNPNGLN